MGAYALNKKPEVVLGVELPVWIMEKVGLQNAFADLDSFRGWPAKILLQIFLAAWPLVNRFF